MVEDEQTPDGKKSGRLVCMECGIPVTDSGLLDLAAYKTLLTRTPKLVSFTHMSNVLGTINPAVEIIRLAHEAGAVTLVDAAQSVPHLKVDVQALDADFLAFSAHKMCGPTGVGALYGKADLLEKMPPFLGGGDMIKEVKLRSFRANSLPHKFEAGTPAIAEAVGFGAAVDYLTSLGMDNVAHMSTRSRNMLWNEETQARTKQNEGRTSEVDQKAGAAQQTASTAQQTAATAAQRAAAAENDAKAVGAKADERAAASRRLMYTVVLSEDQGNFKFNAVDLPDAAKVRIDELITQLKVDPKGVYFEIEGHTDNTGSAALNERIGLERADAVKRYLYEAHHIPLHKINIISFGEEKPVAPNTTRDGRAQNRRVVIRVLA